MLKGVFIFMFISFFGGIYYGVKFLFKRIKANATATILALTDKFETEDEKGKTESTTYKYKIRVNYKDKEYDMSFDEIVGGKSKSKLIIGNKIPVIYDEYSNFVEGMLDEKNRFIVMAVVFLGCVAFVAALMALGALF